MGIRVVKDRDFSPDSDKGQEKPGVESHNVRLKAISHRVSDGGRIRLTKRTDR